MLQKYLFFTYFFSSSTVRAKWALKMDWMNVTISSFSLQSEDKLKECDMEDGQFCKAIRLKKTDLLQIARKLNICFHNLIPNCECGSKAYIPIFGLESLRFCKTKSAGNANLIIIQALKHLYSINERADACKESSFIFQEGNLLKSKEARKPSPWIDLLVSGKSIQTYYTGPVYRNKSATRWTTWMENLN